MMKKELFTFMTAGLLAFAASGANPADELRATREIHCSRLAAPLSLDGDADRNGWEKLHWSGNFIKLASLWNQTDRPTHVALATDGQTLFIGVKMRVSDPASLRGRAGFDLWQNDVVELFFWRPGEKKQWFHLAFDCTGKTYFVREIDIPEMPENYRTEKLEADGIRSGVRLTPDGWMLTAAIPLKKIGGPLTDGMKVNFGRSHRQPYGFDCWTRGPGFRSFPGELRFDADRTEKAEKRYAAALTRFVAEREKLIRSFKQTTYRHRYAFAAGPGEPNYRPLAGNYSPARGYGWLDAEGISSGSLDAYLRKNPQMKKRFKNQSSGILGDNYVFASGPVRNGKVAHTFRIDLPDGEYRVHLLAGVLEHERAPFRRTFTVAADGGTVREFETGYNLHCRYNFPVRVGGGKLELTFEGDGIPADDPEALPLAEGDRKKYFTPGWLVNSIVVTPVRDRKAAMKQIDADELEVIGAAPEELGKYRKVEFRDPEPEDYPAESRKRGFALWGRELGVQLYPGGRPAQGEFLDKLQLRAAAGEFVALNFGLLPLRDLDNVSIRLENLPLKLEESRYVPKLLGGGDYGFVPLFNDSYDNIDHDMNAGENRWLWLVGRLPESIAPGSSLNGSVSIVSEGKTHKIPVEISILPFQLKRPEFAFGGFNPAGYGRPGWSRENRLVKLCAEYDLNAHVFNVDNNRGAQAWTEFEKRLAFYRNFGVKGPFIVGLYLPDGVDSQLRNRKISRIPDAAVEKMVEAARKLVELQKKYGTTLYFFAMDEAHCKGEPYWSEQVRLYKTVKEQVPGLKTASSESDRSIARVQKYLDMPIAFEVDDFNVYRNFQQTATYTNQYLLEPNDMNSGRFQCGMLPGFTPVRAVIPWMLYNACGESGFRESIWNMIQQRGVGGGHFMPKLCTLMGTVGMEDLAYLETLRAEITAALKSGNPARAAAAEEAGEMLRSIGESTKPSARYYYYNGYWKSEVFNRLREMMTEQILKLKKLEK